MLRFFIKELGIKKVFENKKKFESILKEKHTEKKYVLPARSIKSKVSKEEIDGNDIYHFYVGNSDTVILYLHGGAYMNDPIFFHLKFVDRLVRKTGLEAYFPIYPLAPNHNYKETYDLLLKQYKKIIDMNKNVVIIGDSAGGGLALGFSLYLKNLSMKLPNKLVLISPWVDVTLKNPEIKKYEKIDPILSKYGLTKIGKIWAGDLDLHDYRVSPIYSSFVDLPSTMLIAGKREILYPDIQLLNDKMIQDGVKTEMIVKNKMYHIYPLYAPFEGKKVFKRIAEYIVNKD